MSTVRNGTAGAFDTGPVYGYNLEPSLLFVVFFLSLYGLSLNPNTSYDVVILLILVLKYIIKYVKLKQFASKFACNIEASKTLSRALVDQTKHEQSSSRR
jgi:hypothetical protein